MPRARARGARAGLLRGFCVCAAAITVSIATAARAQTVEQFYAGKQIKFVVGSAGGGGYEVYSRLVMLYMSRHLGGRPLLAMQEINRAFEISESANIDSWICVSVKQIPWI